MVHLSRLTCLAVRWDNLTHVPPAITCLGQLQRLYLGLPADYVASLPPGDWLRSLRTLGVSWPVLSASIGVLGTAVQLEHLVSTSNAVLDRKRWPVVWHYVGTHPPLRSFAMEGVNLPSRKAWRALARLRRRRPRLSVHGRDILDEGSFYKELECFDSRVGPYARRGWEVAGRHGYPGLVCAVLCGADPTALVQEWSLCLMYFDSFWQLLFNKYGRSSEVNSRVSPWRGPCCSMGWCTVARLHAEPPPGRL